MKNIQKIVILFTILIASYQISYAPPRGGGNAARPTRNRAGGGGAQTRSNTNTEGNSRARGGAVIHRNNQESQTTPTRRGGALAAGAFAGNQAAQTSEEGAATEEASYPAETTPVMPAIPTDNSQVPYTITQTNNAAPESPRNNEIHPEQENYREQHFENQNDIVNNDTPEAEKQEQAALDIQTIAPDKDEILNQLKAIDSINNKFHAIISSSAMDQLFNNFVYFKNFLVQNFPKEKMMALATEFINQIYPAEHTPAITIAASQPAMTQDTSNTQAAFTPESQEAIPTQAEVNPETSQDDSQMQDYTQEPENQDYGQDIYDQGYSQDVEPQDTQDMVSDTSNEQAYQYVDENNYDNQSMQDSQYFYDEQQADQSE